MRAISLIVPGCLALAAANARAEDRAGGPDARQFDDRIRPFLVKHCQQCHSGEKAKGDLRLDQLSPDFDDRTARERWLAVLKRVQAGPRPVFGPVEIEDCHVCLCGLATFDLAMSLHTCSNRVKVANF
jgi:Planctomycete cytochrome C